MNQPRRLALAFTLLLTLGINAEARPSAEKPAPAVLQAQAGGFSSYLLANGFKIILAPYPSAANVRIELLVKTGSKLEGYGETGMAHLLEHMLFKSAGPRRDLKSDLTALGATWNGTTSADRTNFFEVVAAEPDKVDAAIRLEADRFIRASFTREHLASEMSVVRNELERNDSEAGSLVMRALQRQSYFWHGYGRPTIGARSDIEDAPFSALQAFHKKHYRPDNAALIISGNFDSRRVLALAGQLFAEARNPATPKMGSWTREETRATTNRSELTLPAGKTIAASAWKLPAFTERQTYALDLASSAICDNDWGSLRKDLVLERKLAVSVYCGSQLQADYGLLMASASAGKEANAETLSTALRQHIEGAAARGISQEQLERARQSELNAFERLASSHEQLAQQLSQAEVAGDWRLFFWLRDVTRSITLDEANSALKKWLVGVNRSDVLLRHADGVSAPDMPKATAAGTLVAGQSWPEFAKNGDPIPASAAELAKATINIPLAGERARGALISRHTQGNLAWLVFGNDYGNETAMNGRRTACTMASSLLAYGGAGLNRDQLDARLEALQARWSLSLGGIVIEAPRQNIDAALDILLAAWAAPSLPADEFERIKAASIASLEAGLKNPATLAATTAGLRFDNYPEPHPLKPQSLEQQLAESRAVTLADTKACVADLLGVAQVRLAMVGDFTPADVMATWDKIDRLPKAKTPYRRIVDLAAPLTVDTTPITIAMPEKPNASVAGSTLLRLVDDAPDFPALRIAIKILGGDAESRIWKRLREREGLAYGAGASLSGNSFEPRSRIVIQASAASDKAEAARTSLQDELARALRDGFSEPEVERAKRAWLEERKTSLRSEKSFASYLAQGLYNGRDYAWLAKYDEAISRLNAREVNAALRKYLSDAPMVWMVGRGEKAAQ
ncbi:MAG: insulinase family protein [Azonexus sp.]